MAVAGVGALGFAALTANLRVARLPGAGPRSLVAWLRGLAVRRIRTPTHRGILRSTIALLLALVLTGPAQAQADGPPAKVQWTDIELLDGRILRAADLAQRTVVVEVWASWCPFCARQNPHLQALHDKHGKDLLVLALSIDRSRDVAREYLRKHGYTFAAAMAPAQMEQWFGRRRALPEIYVVQRGQVVLRESGELFPEDIAGLARFADSPKGTAGKAP